MKPFPRTRTARLTKFRIVHYRNANSFPEFQIAVAGSALSFKAVVTFVRKQHDQSKLVRLAKVHLLWKTLSTIHTIALQRMRRHPDVEIRSRKIWNQAREKKFNLAVPRILSSCFGGKHRFTGRRMDTICSRQALRGKNRSFQSLLQAWRPESKRLI